MLSPLGEALAGGPFLELGDLSLERFASFAHALRDETGIDIEYRTGGRLHVSLGDADDELSGIAAAPVASRFGVTLIDGAAARRHEPTLSESITSALLIERDHRVNNRLLAQALLASANAAGAAFRTANAVTSLIVRHNRLEGVQLASGEAIEAQHVVLAAGAWSGRIAGIPEPLPVHPVKGQMFAVDGRAGIVAPRERPPLERVVFSRGCYIIPRDDGRLLVGATMEDVGFSKGATPRGLLALMHAAAAVLPPIQDMPLIETWAGFRPATPDHLPVIGSDPLLPGLIYATGHFRNGILLAPVTADIVAALVQDRTPPVDLEPFSIARFRH